MLPETNPQHSLMAAQEDSEGMAVENGEAGVNTPKGVPDDVLKRLWTLLMETSVLEGYLVCGNCEFEYPIKEGVGNFLLPPHLV